MMRGMLNGDIIALDLTEAPLSRDAERVERFVFTFGDAPGIVKLPRWARAVRRPRLTLHLGGLQDDVGGAS